MTKERVFELAQDAYDSVRTSRRGGEINVKIVARLLPVVFKELVRLEYAKENARDNDV